MAILSRARLTLFMLVSALMGRDRMKAAYTYAIKNGYRFYSYRDASLLLPNNPVGGQLMGQEA